MHLAAVAPGTGPRGGAGRALAARGDPRNLRAHPRRRDPDPAGARSLRQPPVQRSVRHAASRRSAGMLPDDSGAEPILVRPEEIPEELPALPVSDAVIFPHMLVPLVVSDRKLILL